MKINNDLLPIKQSLSGNETNYIPSVAAVKSAILHDKLLVARGAKSVTLTQTGSIVIPITYFASSNGVSNNLFTIANNKITYNGIQTLVIKVTARVYCNLSASRGSACTIGIFRDLTDMGGLTNSGYDRGTTINYAASTGPIIMSLQQGQTLSYYFYGYEGDVIRSDTSNTCLTIESIQ